MKTMPRLMVWWLHVTIEAMRTLVRYWEDKHADHADYRMTHLSAGLHEASTSLREISAGHFDPTRRQAGGRHSGIRVHQISGG